MARDLGYCKNKDELLSQVEKVFALLGGLMKSLREKGKE